MKQLKKNMTRLLVMAFPVVIMALSMVSCIEDGVTTSPSAQPQFSTDTLRLGDLFTLDASPTSRFTVYNRNDKILNISRIAFVDDNDGVFRLNVDGVAGSSFTNVEIRPNDSIFVFVEATLPENNSSAPVGRLAHIEFLTNGVSSRFPVTVSGQDAVRLSGDTRFSGNESLSAEKPYLVSDSIVVEEGATLTVPAGARLLFHSEARMVVHGTLLVEGTAARKVTMCGDRTGYVASDIPYEIMSGQWEGIEFTPTSKENRISHAVIKNSSSGIILDHVAGSGERPALFLHNSVVRNSKGYVVTAIHSDLTAVGCELAEASNGIMLLVGGNHTVNHCTIANYYLFTALGGPAVQFSHVDAESDDESGLPYLTADFANTIIYGNGTEVSHGDLTGLPVYFRRCLLKSAGTDDDNFLSCLWDVDPLYYTDRQAYIFDYHLQPESPAIGEANSSLTHPSAQTDMDGHYRMESPALGAYQPQD